jgi:hypothetical protein
MEVREHSRGNNEERLREVKPMWVRRGGGNRWRIGFLTQKGERRNAGKRGTLFEITPVPESGPARGERREVG